MTIVIDNGIFAAIAWVLVLIAVLRGVIYLFATNSREISLFILKAAFFVSTYGCIVSTAVLYAGGETIPPGLMIVGAFLLIGLYLYCSASEEAARANVILLIGGCIVFSIRTASDRLHGVAAPFAQSLVVAMIVAPYVALIWNRSKINAWLKKGYDGMHQNADSKMPTWADVIPTLGEASKEHVNSWASHR